jgi:hypothetical protein
MVASMVRRNAKGQEEMEEFVSWLSWNGMEKRSV